MLARLEYPTKFGGMLWYTNGDMRAWGSLYWWANQSCYYNGLAPSNRFELLEPTFAMYTKMYDAAAEAAREQWGSQGIWIPETTFFNGPEKLPKEIAAEMRELYLLRKPWNERSESFRRHEQTVQSFSSRWNWIAQGGRFELGRWVHEDKGAPPFGHVTHIFGTTAKVAYLYWQKYEYTLDEAWLRERAYPMLEGRGRVLPKLPEPEEGRRRQVPHLPHQQQRAGVGRQGFGRRSRGDARRDPAGDPGVGDSQRRRGHAAGVEGVSGQSRAAADERHARRPQVRRLQRARACS